MIVFIGDRLLPRRLRCPRTPESPPEIARLQLHADQAHSPQDAGESRALQRIYASALDELGHRIAIDGELERRLAVIVLLAFAAEAPAPDAEGVVARGCVDRLMARCAMA